MRRPRAGRVGVVAVLTALGGMVACAEHPTTPTAAPSEPTLAISGLENYQPYVLTRESFQLKATLTDSTGTRDCTAQAQWSTSDPAIVVPVGLSIPSLFETKAPGTAVITGACGLAKASIPVRVDYFRLSGLVSDERGQPIAGVPVQINNTQLVVTDHAGRYTADQMRFRHISIWVTSLAYEELRREVLWNGTPAMTLDVDAVRLGGEPLVEGTSRLCSRDPGRQDEIARNCVPYGALKTQDHFYFSVPADGTLRLDLYGSAYDDRILGELRCNDQLVSAVDGGVMPLRPLLEVPARKGCDYELKFRGVSNGFVMDYSYRVTYRPN